jgi:glycyl-tRNA synthetase alpha subunit
MREVFERFEAEANACLENGLIVPAHDYVLKCSHTFNILDTRGAIGVAERQAYFRRMRELARRVAVAIWSSARNWNIHCWMIVKSHRSKVGPQVNLGP